jgi:hypothetical protein
MKRYALRQLIWNEVNYQRWVARDIGPSLLRLTEYNRRALFLAMHWEYPN